MKLTVKLVGTFRKYLPRGSVGNTTEVETDDNVTVARLIQDLGLPADQRFIVSVNDNIVPIAERQSRSLDASDSIKFIPPLKGG